MRASMAGRAGAFGARSTSPSTRRHSRSAPWRSPAVAWAPLGRLLRNRLPGNGRARAARSARPDPRGRSNRLRHGRRRLRHRSPAGSNRWRRTGSPAATPSRTGARTRSSHPGATPSRGRRTAPGRVRGTRPCARSSGWAELYGANGAAITAEVGPRPTLSCIAAQYPAGQWMNCMKLLGQKLMSVRHRPRTDGGSMPHLRPPDRRAPSPHRNPQPLHRARHPPHTTRRLIAARERGNSAFLRFAQQGPSTQSKLVSSQISTRPPRIFLKRLCSEEPTGS